MSVYDDQLFRTKKQITELMEEGYSKQESIQLIQAAALKTLAECCKTDYCAKPYIHISGNVATYEQ